MNKLNVRKIDRIYKKLERLINDIDNMNGDVMDELKVDELVINSDEIEYLDYLKDKLSIFIDEGFDGIKNMKY